MKRPTWLAAASMTGLLVATIAGSVTGAQGAPAAVPQAVPKPAVVDTALESKTSALAAQLRCPVCKGASMQDSPAELAQQMRGLVKEQLSEGKTPEEIKAYFVDKYGEWILLQPRASGFNLLIFALPVLVVAGGLAVVVVAMRRWTKQPEDQAQPPSL